MSQGKGPVPGFSKGVNDALVAASSLVHLKAACLLGFALTLSGIVVTRPPEGFVAGGFHYAGVLVLIAASCFAGAVIYPMKSTRRDGVIFWGDIAIHPSAEAYAKDLERVASAEEADREYSFTNYRLSAVLEAKYGLIRWAVCLLLLGAALAGMGRVAQ